MSLVSVVLSLLACSKAQSPSAPEIQKDAQTSMTKTLPNSTQPEISKAAPVPFGIDGANAYRKSPASKGSTHYAVSADSELFDTRVRALLKNTRVNDAISLGEYIELLAAAKTDPAAKLRIEAIQAKGKPETTIRRMTLIASHAQPGASVVFQFWLNGDQYSGDEVEKFWTFLHEEGGPSRLSPAVHPDRRTPRGEVKRKPDKM